MRLLTKPINQMKAIYRLLLLAFFMPAFANAQDEEGPKRNRVELTYIKVKIGREKEFVEGVKKHNAEYHKEGTPYNAGLYYVRAGKDAGQYVWVMGPYTYADLDKAPGAGDHASHWTKNIAKHIKDYGNVDIWTYNDKLSSPQESKVAVETIMWIRVKRGQMHRMRDFMEKVNAVQKENVGEMYVYNNAMYSTDSPNMAITFPSENWADFDTPGYNMMEKYDEKYGEGSWRTALDDWADFVEHQSESLWESID